MKENQVRVISLVPAATEVLFAVGAGRRVAAVTDHCDYPAEVAGLARVGPFGRPDADRISALQPDLVVTGGRIHEGIETFLASARIKTYRFFPPTVEDMLTAMEELAELSGTGTTGRSAVDGLRARVATITVESASARHPSALFLMGEPPLTTPGPAFCQYDALQLAGAGMPSLPGSEPFMRLNWQELQDCDPEVIFVCGRSGDQPVPGKCPGCRLENPPCRRNVNELYEQERLAVLRAVRTMRVYPLACSRLCRPGPRLVDGMEYVRAILRRSTTAE